VGDSFFGMGLPGGGMIEFDEDTDEEWGWYDGQCYACDLFGRVDDLGLCEECRTKLERDLIRQRDWDYSAWAFGLSPYACHARSGPRPGHTDGHSDPAAQGPGRLG
jgi:hypothetical protein